MPSITVELTERELTQAVADWLDKNGYETTDRFAISINTIRGDRPFDPDQTTVTAISGVHTKQSK